MTALITALPVEDNTTVPPLALRRLLLASASVTVTLEVVVPSATILVGVAVSVVFPLVGSAGNILLRSEAWGKPNADSPGFFHRPHNARSEWLSTR